MDYSSPGSSVRGILQAKILEWVAMPSSRASSQPRDWTSISYVSSIGRWVFFFFFFFTTRACWKPRISTWSSSSTPRFISKKIKTHVYTKAFIKTFIIAKGWKQPKWLSTDEWINKMRHFHVMEHYLATNRNKHWHMSQHGWTLTTRCQVKEVGCKRPNFVWFPLCDMPKSIKTESMSVVE